MSDKRDEYRLDAVAEFAAGWFARLQDEAATSDDWLAFETWLAASPDHAAAYERLEGLWIELDDLADEVTSALDAPMSLSAYRAANTTRSLSRRGWLAVGAGLAASLAIAVGVGVTRWPETPTEAYATAAGQTRQLTLADGSRVWLNAGSRIAVRFERRARRIQMADGEAVFDVTHDPRRPFLIDTGDREVRVVGTEFNLRQRAEDFALTVRRGVVEVRYDAAPGKASTRVPAGQRLSQTGRTPAVLTATDPNAAFAWTQGQLVYSDATLKVVAADLSRSLGISVRVADAATGRIRFSGVLEIDDKTAVLRRLEAFAPVRAERVPGGVVLHRR